MKSNSKSKIFFILSVVFLLAYFVTPVVPFGELDDFGGKVVSLESKSTAGYTIEILSEDNVAEIFNIPNSTKEVNIKVSSLGQGSDVRVWYDDRYVMKDGAHDAWQLEVNDDVLISYSEVRGISDLYSKIFLALTTLFFFLTIYFYRKERINSNNTGAAPN